MIFLIGQFLYFPLPDDSLKNKTVYDYQEPHMLMKKYLPSKGPFSNLLLKGS